MITMLTATANQGLALVIAELLSFTLMQTAVCLVPVRKITFTVSTAMSNDVVFPAPYISESKKLMGRGFAPRSVKL